MKVKYVIVLRDSNNSQSLQLSDYYKSKYKAVKTYKKLKKVYPDALLKKVKKYPRITEISENRKKEKLITALAVILLCLAVSIMLSFIMDYGPSIIEGNITGDIEDRSQEIYRDVLKYKLKDSFRDNHQLFNRSP